MHQYTTFILSCFIYKEEENYLKTYRYISMIYFYNHQAYIHSRCCIQMDPHIKQENETHNKDAVMWQVHNYFVVCNH